jgi:hypothetical protein
MPLDEQQNIAPGLLKVASSDLVAKGCSPFAAAGSRKELLGSPEH